MLETRGECCRHFVHRPMYA